MESLLVHFENKTQLEKVKAFLKEMRLSFEKIQEKKPLEDLPRIPNAETRKAIEEGRKEKPFLKSFSDIDELMKSLEND